ncbi:MAG: outer-membrane lipoprotein carrier protein LolA [Pseudorhodoplanes sp.]
MKRSLLAIGTAFILGTAVPPRAPAQTVPPPPAAVAPGKAGQPGVPLRPPLALPGTGTVAPKPGTIANQPGEPFNAAQRALADKISGYLTGVRTMVGEFVQVGPDGARTKGQLYMQKPGRVRFEYDEPSPIELIADGSSVVVRDRKLATQDLYPLGQTPLKFLLADKLDLLKDTNVVGIYSDDVFSTVVIEEKQKLIGTHRLMMMFSAQDLQLKQWTITDPQGYDTTVAIYNLDTTKKPDPGLFKINYERVLQ